MGARSLARQRHLKFANGILLAMGHQPLRHHKGSIFRQGCPGLAVRGINPFNLHRFHLHVSVLADFHNSFRIHNPSAVSGTAAVMLFHIFDTGALFNKKAVNPVMLAVLMPTVVDAATGNNGHIRSRSNMKIIIYQFLNTALAHHHRNINRFVLCARRYKNINPLHLCFAHNAHIGRALTLRRDAVGANIESALRHSLQSGNLQQQVLLCLVNPALLFGKTIGPCQIQ